jgi:hypothetical protein
VVKYPIGASFIHLVKKPLFAIIRDQFIIGTVFYNDNRLGIVVVLTGLQWRSFRIKSGWIRVFTGL